MFHSTRGDIAQVDRALLLQLNVKILHPNTLLVNYFVYFPHALRTETTPTERDIIDYISRWIELCCGPPYIYIYIYS